MNQNEGAGLRYLSISNVIGFIPNIKDGQMEGFSYELPSSSYTPLGVEFPKIHS